MNTFVNTLQKQAKKTRTENGALTRTTSNSANVDLFFTIGALRGQDENRVISAFKPAFEENEDYATRILLWARDIRGGAGERETFRRIFKYIEMNKPELFIRVARKIPTLGRFDDLLVAQTTMGKEVCFSIIRGALEAKNGLAAKWMPRKGEIAAELRAFLGYSPKRYRKTLVDLTKVVETQMCAKKFDEIEYSHVPSLAMSRYSKAFKKRDLERFSQFLGDVTTGEKKINAGAVYPYDVLKSLYNSFSYSYHHANVIDLVERQRIVAQWDALPDYMGDKNILPMIDVSGSMASSCGGNLRCIDISTSLGLYMATKAKGAFKDVALTFDTRPQLLSLKGDIVDKFKQVFHGAGTSTNLEGAFNAVLKHAVTNRVPQSDMPEYVVVLSDMEFDQPYAGDTTLSKNIENQYAAAGYKLPVIVWWNIQSRGDNVPVKAGKKNNVLVSGFSPAIAKTILAMDLDNALERIDPVNVMKEAILVERYDY